MTKLNRRDIGYTIISRFEKAFRAFLSECLEILFEDYQEGIPLGIIQKAKERTRKETWESIEDFFEDIDFPDLKEISCYKSNYEIFFIDLKSLKNKFIDDMDQIYNLRCRIAHVRGFFTSLDLDKLLELTKERASFLDKSGRDFLDFTKVLEERPETVTVTIPIGFETNNVITTSIPNNIPIADYEYEGGFVGRENDIKKITMLLEGEQVVTIAGAGGVGKTALASKVIEQFLKHDNIKFQGIIWLSAKENKLSYLGIEDLEPTIKSYEQLLDTVLEVMGFPSVKPRALEEKESDFKIVSELYQSILIVIDNLETITDESIVNFLLDIRVTHPNIKILITSRRGLGQVERRYELKELKEREAILLFRLIAKDKELNNLVKLDEIMIKKLVKRVSCYPLAIKWMLGQVALGKAIQEVIDSIEATNSDISKFSFEQIYNSLSVAGRKILCVLSCFDEPPSTGVLAYVVGLEKIDLEDGIKELILVSLVIPEPFKTEQGEVLNRYILLPLTRGYVRQQLDKDTSFKHLIEDRLRQVKITLEEADRASKQYRFNLSNMGAETEEEKVAAMIAQNAFHKYQTGKYIEAYEEYKRACAIAPKFASIYRNWAMMESQEGHFVEADKLMEKASKLNNNDAHIWLTWGNIKRKNDKIKEAQEKYEKAYYLMPDDPSILNSLGNTKSRSGEYEEADKLFMLAMSKEVQGSSLKHQIINFSSLAENLFRWGKSLSKIRNNQLAEGKYKEALVYCEKLLKLDKDDYQSKSLYRRINMQVGFFYKGSNSDLAISYFEKVILKKPSKYIEIKDSVKSAIQITELLIQKGEFSRARTICSLDLLKSSEGLEHDMYLHDELKLLIRKLERNN